MVDEQKNISNVCFYNLETEFAFKFIEKCFQPEIGIYARTIQVSLAICVIPDKVRSKIGILG